MKPCFWSPPAVSVLPKHGGGEFGHLRSDFDFCLLSNICTISWYNIYLQSKLPASVIYLNLLHVYRLIGVDQNPFFCLGGPLFPPSTLVPRNTKPACEVLADLAIFLSTLQSNNKRFDLCVMTKVKVRQKWLTRKNRLSAIPMLHYPQLERSLHNSRPNIALAFHARPVNRVKVTKTSHKGQSPWMGQDHCRQPST